MDLALHCCTVQDHQSCPKRDCRQQNFDLFAQHREGVVRPHVPLEQHLDQLLQLHHCIAGRPPPDPLADQTIAKKSIAVLPFINDSNDSTNVYIINGLMESTLNNLQKIKELRVISRTSVEKYRNNPKTIPEIARELNVHYLIEGSGQKIGDQILLNIQLIEAPSDKHLWSEQYNRRCRCVGGDGG